MPGMEPAGVEPIDDIQHEPDQMPRWQPLPQRGRHQELLITINRTIRTSHAPVFRESPQHSRTPPGDLATASATPAKGPERHQTSAEVDDGGNGSAAVRTLMGRRHR